MEPPSARIVLPPAFVGRKCTKLVRERYLRETVSCRSPLCTDAACHAPMGSGSGSGSVSQIWLGASASHYLILNTGALLRFLEVFELSNWTSIIILRSVLAELPAKTQGVVRKLLQDPKRRMVLFEDDYSLPTFQSFLPDAAESSLARADRSVAAAARYYAAHLSASPLPIVVLAEPHEPGAPLSPALASLGSGSSHGDGGSVELLSLSDYLSSEWRPLRPDLVELYQSIVDAEAARHEARAEADRLLTQLQQQQGQAAEAPQQQQQHSTLYPPYWPAPLLDAGLRAGSLLRGHLHVSKTSNTNAFVDLGGQSRLGVRELLIVGEESRNRAVHGDLVVVQPLPRSLWATPTRRIEHASPAAAAPTDAEGKEEAGSASSGSVSKSRGDAVPTGRIVGVLERRWRPLVATLQPPGEGGAGGGAGGKYALAVPLDPRMPKIRLRTREVGSLQDTRLLVQLDEWSEDSRWPLGHYIKRIGPVASLETNVMCILIENQVSHPPFPAALLSHLPSRPRAVPTPPPSFGRLTPANNPFWWDIPQAFMEGGRRDLRESHRGCVVSIDPPGCVDIDDALSYRDLGNGRCEVGVHIADVTAFLPAESPLDLEARARGTSVYLVDRRLDMLPGILSTDLCSLRGGTDRLTVSVLWEMEAATGRVFSRWMGRTAVRNAFALSYQDADDIIRRFGSGGERDKGKGRGSGDGEGEEKRKGRGMGMDRAVDGLSVFITEDEARALCPRIIGMRDAARRLKAERMAKGALELESFALKFRLDDSKKPVDVEQEEHLEVHDTIEEWMLAANREVARKLWDSLPGSALLRHHAPPKPHKFAELLECASTLGLSIDVSSNAALAKSLAAAGAELERRKARGGNGSGSGSGSREDDYALRILKSLATRAMSEAAYMSTGGSEASDLFHYGLSAEFYTHFTSPIRRYADIIVHRQLLAVLERERSAEGTLTAPLPASASHAHAHAAAAAAAAVAVAADEKSDAHDEAEHKDPEDADSDASLSLGLGIMDDLLATGGASLELDLFQHASVARVAQHINDKHRQAKLAAQESAELFLAWYLSKPAPSLSSPSSSSSAPGGFTARLARHERATATVYSLRDNGLMVLVNKYKVKGAVLLQDRQGRALVLPPADGGTVSEMEEGDPDDPPVGPPCSLAHDAARGELTMVLSQPLPSSSSSLALPLRRTFRLFETVTVDVSISLRQSRYRTPRPVFTLVWTPPQQQQQQQEEEQGSRDASARKEEEEAERAQTLQTLRALARKEEEDRSAVAAASSASGLMASGRADRILLSPHTIYADVLAAVSAPPDGAAGDASAAPASVPVPAPAPVALVTGGSARGKAKRRHRAGTRLAFLPAALAKPQTQGLAAAAAAVGSRYSGGSGTANAGVNGKVRLQAEMRLLLRGSAEARGGMEEEEDEWQDEHGAY